MGDPVYVLCDSTFTSRTAIVMKRADASPPLGSGGGACRVVERILRERLPPSQTEEMVQIVESDGDLSNAQASKVYDSITEFGPSPFDRFVLTPHAQYRMDLRNIRVNDLRDALQRFVKEIGEWKKRRDPRYERLLSNTQKVEWLDQKSGLFFVFGLGRNGGAPAIITTYWKNRVNPPAPSGGCTKRVANDADLFGISTFRGEKPSKGILNDTNQPDKLSPGESPRSDRDRALPQRPSTKENLEEHRPGPPVFNTPGPSSGPGAEGKPMKVRTPGKPGEEYGHPFKNDIAPRRTTASDDDEGDEEREVEAGLVPTYSQRQRKQRGKAKRYYQKYYRRHRNKIKMRAKRRYKRIRRNPTYKRRQKIRRDPRYMSRFRRIPNGGRSDLSDRTASMSIGFFHMTYGWGDVVDFADDGVVLHLDGESEECAVVPLPTFMLGVVFDGDEDTEAFFNAIEEAYGVPDPRWVAAAYREVEAGTFYRETFTPGHNMDAGPGAQDLGAPGPNNVNDSLRLPDDEHEDRPTSHKLDISPTTNNPGSAKVIPSGHGFVNKEASGPSAIRVAKRLAELLDETSGEVKKRSKGLKPKGRRFNPKTSMFTFSVPGQTSAQTYVVQAKILRKGNATKVSKMDLLVSCSCPFWQWQGPEHWAKVGNYLYGKARGTASQPVVKDPKNHHRVCKHVAACLESIRNWELAAATPTK